MKKKEILLIICLYFIGLFFRLYQLKQTNVYPDEITWMVKGKETFYALTKGNLNYFRTAWWNNTEETYAIGWPLVVLNGISHVVFAGDGQYSLHLFSDIVASRLPLAVVGSFTAVAIFLFAKKFFKEKIAFLVALAYALNPITIALDRWVIHDSFLTLFSFLSMTTFITAQKEKKLNYWSGVWLSLAFLTKPHGVLPIISWVTLLLIYPNRFSVKLFFGNLFSFLLTTTLIWPQSWIEPIISIPNYFIRQYTLASSGRPIPNFFFVPTHNPHWSYFIFQLFFRTPVMILALGSIGLVFMKKKSPVFLAVLAYLILEMIAISSVATKGGVRYALPLLPWIYLLAGYGLQKIYHSLIIVTLLISVFSTLIIFHPDYYLYYNFLIGGPQNAQKVDLVGLCFGTKPSLEYLDKNKIAGLTGVIGCYDTAPYHTSRPLTKNWADADILILENSYFQQYPQRTEVLMLSDYKLLQTITQKGAITARIYQKKLN